MSSSSESSSQSGHPHSSQSHSSHPHSDSCDILPCGKEVGYDKCIIYNYELDCWTIRSYFPHSMMTRHFDVDERRISDLTNTFEEAVVTWDEKRTKGVLLFITGDENGFVYVHGFDITGNGIPLTGVLETGDITLGTHSKPKRVNKVVLGTRRLSMNTPVTIEVGAKQHFDDIIDYEEPIFLNGLPSVDCRVTGNLLKFRLKTNGTLVLADHSIYVQGAGDRG